MAKWGGFLMDMRAPALELVEVSKKFALQEDIGENIL
jgi:hypothetical protein